MIEINILSSFLIISIFIILYFRENNALPNKILAFALFVPGLNYMNNIFILTEGIYHFPYAYFFVQITGSLFAPLTFYYIMAMTGLNKPKSYPILLLFSAVIIVFGISISSNFYFLTPNEQLYYLHRVKSGPYPDDMELYSLLFFSHQLLYFSINVLQVRRFRVNSMQHLSSLHTSKVSYLYHFVILLWVLTFAAVFLYATIDTIYVEYVYLPLVLIVIFLFIVYHAFNHNAVFTESEFAKHLNKVVSPMSKETETCTQDSSLSDKSFLKILELIEDNELYKNPEVSIALLSEHSQVPAYRIATCIKENGTTFYEIIRKLRVKKARELLTDHSCNFTIEAIAYEVGFNSRASFYRAFRKYENCDPSSLINRELTI